MDTLLELLSETEYVSGEKLCATLGVTRGAVWKRIEKLRGEGYPIESAGKRGYRLPAARDSLLPGYVARELQTRWAGRGLILYEQVMDSTNARLKELARQGAPRGSLALCELQTAGRGRLQRAWETPAGEALLCSLLLRPGLPAEKAQLVTLAAAVSIAEAIKDVCPILKPGVKWPNDVVLNGKKCVGILSEMAADMDGVHYIALGVGVNANQTSFPDELCEKATSLRLALGERAEPLCRRALLAAFLARMERAADALEAEGSGGLMDAYAKLSVTLGARVRVQGVNLDFVGMAEGLDDTGALLVTDENGETRRVLSGDVSVRGLMGYC